MSMLRNAPREQPDDERREDAANATRLETDVRQARLRDAFEIM